MRGEVEVVERKKKLPNLLIVNYYISYKYSSRQIINTTNIAIAVEISCPFPWVDLEVGAVAPYTYFIA
jgi:hypothetical protein